jgi:Ca2+/Na+ antiporter
LPNGLLAVFYLIALLYLFIGVGAVSDIFMESIEKITSEEVPIQLFSKDGKPSGWIDVPRWNATVANLTLMALGSSAPEILLSVL